MTEILIIFQNRGSALDLCGPLVVRGWSQTGVPQHQQLCHACHGNPSLSGRYLPLQRGLSLPKGNGGLRKERALVPGLEPCESCWAKTPGARSLLDTQS